MLSKVIVVFMLVGTTLTAHAAGEKASAEKPMAASANKDRSTNISINPLGFAFGAFNTNVDFKMSDRFTLGPSVAFTSVTSGVSKATGYGIGANANFYLSNDAFNDSWIVSVGAEYAYIGIDNLSASGLGFGATIGYGWFWDSGFNIGLGAGLQYVSLDYTKIGFIDISAVLPRLSFSLGYAF